MTSLKYVLAGSMVVIKVLMTVNGIPGGLFPNLPIDFGSSSKYIDSLLDNIPSDEKLEKAKEKLEKVTDVADGLPDDEDQMNAIQEGDGVELFKLIQKSEGCQTEDVLLGWTPDFSGLCRVSPNAGVEGSSKSKWVLEKHKDLYQQYGDPGAREHLESAKGQQKAP